MFRFVSTCDDATRPPFASQVADKWKDDDLQLSLTDDVAAMREEGIDACEYEDSYQRFTITVLANGVYEGGKVSA